MHKRFKPKQFPAPQRNLNLAPRAQHETQLESELGSINKKLSLLSQAIKTTDASPDNELFMKSMRNFYMLSELRNQLQGKIDALEGL